MSPVFAVPLLIMAALGGGAALLRVTQADRRLRPAERMTWSFTLGFGLLGWLPFFMAPAGAFTSTGFTILCLILSPGTLLLVPAVAQLTKFKPSPAFLGLSVLLSMTAAAGVMAALSPMADADTLAYHYPLARMALEQGQPAFIPRAVDGAVPQLIQMTYAVAMALGGETSCNWWLLISSWMAGATLYATARRWLAPTPALLLLLLFQSVPAVLYGAVTGQIEVRMAMMTLVMAVATAEAVAGSVAMAVTAGLVAGFLIGCKYTALLVVAAAGLVLLMFTRRPVLLLAFAGAALAFGWPWYAWMWTHTGDPVFPMLWGLVDFRPETHWSPAQNLAFKSFAASEHQMPENLWTILTYPFRATFAPLPVFEAGRTGFGPAGMILLPFAVLGTWHHRTRLAGNPLTVMVAIAALAYLAWMLIGPSQRVRHLLPLLPLALLALAVASQRAAATGGWRIAAPLLLGVTVTLALQSAGQAVNAIKYARYLMGPESTDSFLNRNVPGWPIAQWANNHLTADDRLMLFPENRVLAYHLRVDSLLVHPFFQGVVDVRPNVDDPDRLWRQMRAAGVTHVAVANALSPPLQSLAAQGCLKPVQEFQLRQLASRTLPGLSAVSYATTVWALDGHCWPSPP